MLFDVLELRRLPKGRDIPVQMPKPFVQSRIPGSDIADVAFEVLHVDWIKADDSRVEPDVCLGNGRAKVIG